METRVPFLPNAENNPNGQSIITAFDDLGPYTLLTVGTMAKIFDRCPVSIKRECNRGELPLPICLFKKDMWFVINIRNHFLALAEATEKRAA
jgi:hypothetical protein